MAPRKKVVKEDLGPVPTMSVSIAHVVALRVDELPFLTFIGKTWLEARASMIAELQRRYPQGYFLQYPEQLSSFLDTLTETRERIH